MREFPTLGPKKDVASVSNVLVLILSLLILGQLLTVPLRLPASDSEGELHHNQNASLFSASKGPLSFQLFQEETSYEYIL